MMEIKGKAVALICDDHRITRSELGIATGIGTLVVMTIIRELGLRNKNCVGSEGGFVENNIKYVKDVYVVNVNFIITVVISSEKNRRRYLPAAPYNTLCSSI